MSRWRVPLALFACSALFLVLAVACGDGDDSGSNGANGGSTSQQHSTEAPQLAGPASKYSLLNPEDFQAGFITIIGRHREFDAADYGSTGIFESPEKGEELLNEWGYEGGFQSGVDPENRDTARLNGAWGVLQELHLFKTEAGAKDAFAYFKDRLGGAGQGAPVGIEPVGNESVAWLVVNGKIGASQVDMAHYLVLFRRGNLVATVVANGAETLITSDTARRYALMIDEKALGQRRTIEPTPPAAAVREGAQTTPTAQP